MIRRTAALILAMILVSSLAAFPALSENDNAFELTGTVSGTTKLHMRSAPSTEASVVTDLKSGAKVTVL